MGESSHANLPAASAHLEYSTTTGYFLQDDPATDPDTFDYTRADFGLIDRPYDADDADLQRGDSRSSKPTPWQRFARKLASLNEDSPEGTSYRLLFLGRHGQGYHNVAEAFYGPAAWDCYYSTLNGTNMTIWADAHLTSTGIDQAKTVNEFWRSQIVNQHMPTPQSFYSSPLDRALHTAAITFADLDLEHPFRPIVKELIREGIGIHTCDRRSSRKYLTSHYPDCVIEEGFAEEDPLWVPDLRESPSAQTARLRTLLDDVFEHDSSTWISITSHGGTIQSILRAVGHRDFTVQTGGVLPVLVKVKRVPGSRPKDVVAPWGPKPDCEDEDVLRRGEAEALRRLDEHVKSGIRT